MFRDLYEKARGRIEPIFINPQIRAERYEDELMARGHIDANMAMQLYGKSEKGRDWTERWAGRLPQGWERAETVMLDLRRAHRLRIQLSPQLQEASVTHPVYHTVVDTASNQILPPELYWLGYRQNMPDWAKAKYVSGQSNLRRK